jgi:Kef-type K+ transport system membrane component KefB
MKIFSQLFQLSLPVSDPVLIFALVMLVILLVPLVFNKLRIPPIVGLILAGTLVGPSVLGLLERDQTIVLLGTVGLLYLMFMAGLSIDLNQFNKMRDRSLVFGLLSFFIPQIAAIIVGTQILDYSLATSLLLGSIVGSHTLLAYPIASRLGIAKDSATTTAVGGTIVTDTAALLVLAGVVGALEAGFEILFWMQLLGWIAAFALVTVFIVPRVSRWFFRRVDRHGTTDYLFVLVVQIVIYNVRQMRKVDAR